MTETVRRRPRILLVWPEIPPTTYWSFSRALALVGKRVSSPPLGLATVAAMLPEERYELRLHDEGLSPLTDDQIRWADALFTSAMIVQRTSLERLVRRAARLGVPVVAGGPHPSVSYAELPGVSHFVIGEAEHALPPFLADWERGAARRAYARPADATEVDELRAHFGDDLDVALATERPELDRSPIPRFDLLDRDAYQSMAVQFSRGCPVGCEFCDIWTRLGRRPRSKSPARVIAELQALYELGWRAGVFVVDDNFVGNARRTLAVVSAMATWQRAHDYPFTFYTEATLRLADKPALLQRMRDAAFDMVFVGIETPAQASLEETGKRINRVDRVADQVATIQRHGIEVTSGFILGFDSDPPDIARRMVRFIQQLGIPLAMVGLLMAPPRSALWRRMEAEGRLTDRFSGNNTHDFATNIQPLIPMSRLVGRYKEVLQSLYSPSMRSFFARCATLRARWIGNPHARWRFSWRELAGVARSVWVIGRRRYGPRYLRFLLTTALTRPTFLSVAIRLGMQGHHLRQITAGAFELQQVGDHLGELRRRFSRAVAEPGRWAAAVAEIEQFRARRLEQLTPAMEARHEALRAQLQQASESLERLKQELLADARRRMRHLSREYEESIATMYGSFSAELDRLSAPLRAPTLPPARSHLP